MSWVGIPKIDASARPWVKVAVALATVAGDHPLVGLWTPICGKKLSVRSSCSVSELDTAVVFALDGAHNLNDRNVSVPCNPQLCGEGRGRGQPWCH